MYQAPNDGIDNHELGHSEGVKPLDLNSGGAEDDSRSTGDGPSDPAAFEPRAGHKCEPDDAQAEETE